MRVRGILRRPDGGRGLSSAVDEFAPTVRRVERPAGTGSSQVLTFTS